MCQCEGCGVKHKLVDHLNVFGGEAGQVGAHDHRSAVMNIALLLWRCTACTWALVGCSRTGLTARMCRRAQEAVGAGAEPRRPLQPQARSPEAEALWSNLPERFREMPKTWEGGVGLVGLLRGLGRHPDSDDDTEDLLA